MLSNGNLFDAETKERMCTDIYDDAMWLIDLVENLLSVSRLEEGGMNLHISTEPVSYTHLILVFVVYIFAALTFFPALALGPIAEHLTLWG